MEASTDPRSWTVLVTIAPHKYFVEKIAGDTVKTLVLLPVGANAHTFDPTPKQVFAASGADLWFKLGEPFEGQTLAALKSHNSRLQPVELSKDIELLSGHCSHHKHCSSSDLHYWLSPKAAKIQAKTITDALIRQYPENGKVYTNNYNAFIKELDELDSQVAIILNPLNSRTFFVSHPAYAYFGKDYNLHQISIEFEGKDPSPKQLTKILDKARELQVKTIFLQPQFSNKGAKVVAELIGAKGVMLDPFEENYPKMILDIATKISQK